MDRVYHLHQMDLGSGYDGAFMINSIEKKYKNVGKQFIWRWYFPGKNLTKTKDGQEMRRYHLHKTHVQKALRDAVKKPQKEVKRSSESIIKRDVNIKIVSSFTSHQSSHDAVLVVVVLYSFLIKQNVQI